MPLTRFHLDVPELADGHMRGPNVSTLLGAVGAQLDAAAEQVMWGRLQANVFAGGVDASRSTAARLADGRLLECEPFMLPVHAAQRGVRLYPSEPLLSQRVRLSQAKRAKRMRGTHRGKLLDAQTFFLGLATVLPTMDIVHQAGAGASATWHRLDSSGVYSVSRVTPSNFDYDGHTARWWRWWAFVRMTGTGIAAPHTYGGGGTYGGGWSWGCGGLTGAQLQDLAAIFQQDIGAHGVCAGVALCWSSGDVPPAGTPTQDATGWWSLPDGHWGSTVDPTTGLGTRPPTVQWIYP